MSINDFKASPGWVTNFKKRHNLSQFIRQGEANSAPLENLPRFRNELQQLIQLYPIENVFNCDETALFYRLDPIKTLAHGSVTGRKKAKNRVTLMFTVSATGEKLKPLNIKIDDHSTELTKILYQFITIGTRPHGCKFQFSNTGFVNLTKLCVNHAETFYCS